MNITYCSQWNLLLRQPRDPMTEEQARAAHEAGELYTAVVDEPGEPLRLVEVRLEVDYVAARKTGPHGRDVEKLTFTRQPDGRLFLDSATMWDYDRPDPRAFSDATVITIAYFKPDGTMTGVVRRRDDPEVERLTGRADVEPNWEDDWGFGHYERLLDFRRPIGYVPGERPQA